MIIHLKGTMCSGKSWTYESFKDRKDVAVWDVQEFYKSYRCYKADGTMNWKRWKDTVDVLPGELVLFLNNNKDKLCIVESGGSSHVKKTLQEFEHHTIELVTPNEETLTLRAKESKKDLARVLEFCEVYKDKYSGPAQNMLTPEETRMAIKGKLDGINIGIIGSAGRGEDEDRMSKKVYGKMFRHLLQYLDRLGLTKEDITLVSGGAAWCDHLAVSLYLDGKAKAFKLHLPVPFDSDSPQFSTSQKYHSTLIFYTVKSANKYHYQFGEKMNTNRESTLVGLSKAIDKGAEVIITPGFKPRDLKIAAESELLVALTWFAGVQPKPKSGTLYTWSNCIGTKVHIPIQSLMR